MKRPRGRPPGKPKVKLTCQVDPQVKKALGDKPGAELSVWHAIVKEKTK